MKCGSLIPRIHGLCRFCEKHLFARSLPLGEGIEDAEGDVFKETLLPRLQKPIPLFWTMTWRNEPEAWVSSWARSLKGSKSETAWAWRALANEVLLRRGESLTQSLSFRGLGRRVVVVTPSQSRDHAFYFAQALVEILGWSHISWSVVPQKTANREQKKASKQGRLGRTFNRHKGLEMEGFFSRKDHFHWLFVDDIWTTGATAEGVYDALGRPLHFSSLVFFKREDLV